MDNGTIMGLLAFLAACIGVIKPIISLNNNIVELNTTLKQFELRYKENHTKLENRMAIHGDKIDELEKTATAHDIRISAMEKGGK